MKYKLKILVGLIAFFCNQSHIFCQNLINNGSFEDINSCTVNFSPVGTFCCVKNWFSATSIGSPDLFSIEACDIYTLLPNNYYFGNIFPFDGDNMAGLHLYSEFYSISGFFQTGEFMSVKLKKKLIKDKLYCLSFYTFNVLHYDLSNLNIKNWGILFSENEPSGSYYLSNNIAPSIIVNNYFEFNNTWNNHFYNFSANGDEEFITIGSVFGQNIIEKMDMSTGHPVPSKVYVFFDFFNLECCDPNGCDEISTGENINTPKLHVYPNPASQQISLKFSEPFSHPSKTF